MRLPATAGSRIPRGFGGAAPITTSAWCVLALVATTTTAARADDPPDVRSPVRFGFAYTSITQAPEVSLSWGLALDVAHLSERLTVQLVGEAEVHSRPDLPDSNPVSSFSDVGIGAGLFYVTEGEIGFGFDVTTSLTFDANDLVGGGLAFRTYFYPFYMRLRDALAQHQRRFVFWARSSIALWGMARVDWTGDGNGGTFAFGVSVDLFRFFFVPYLLAVTETLK